MHFSPIGNDHGMTGKPSCSPENIRTNEAGCSALFARVQAGSLGVVRWRPSRLPGAYSLKPMSVSAPISMMKVCRASV